MDYLDFGDTIDYNKFNALVYLLRKFKKLTTDLELGAYDINTDYGSFHFTDGFVPVGNNWILEDNVTVTGSNVLLNSFYTFVFTVVDVNTSGVVNKRLIRVTSESTGETGNLSLSIPSDLINNDEVILPNFTLEVVFDEHEYYTPLPDVHLSLSVDKRIIDVGEVATVTGLLVDGAGEPMENISVPLNVNGSVVTVITDSTGEFNYVYTGTGTRGKVLVSALGESVVFYDGTSDYVTAVVTGNSITLGDKSGYNWLVSSGSVVVDWGDGTSDTVNNPQSSLSHTYSDGLSKHLIIFDGTVTSLGVRCFYGCSGLTSVVIPDSVTSLGTQCFYNCTGLTSITIPDSVTSLGVSCFNGCYGLTSIVIPDGVTSLGVSCFSGCYGLTSIVIPDGVTSLGDRCFNGCSGLTSIVIPDGVTSLGDLCFSGCYGLTSVTIPDSVTSIGGLCFYECSGLIDYELYWETQPVTYASGKMPVNTNTVFNIPYGKTQLYVDANYPSARLVEREPLEPLDTVISISSDKQSIYTNETVNITGTLLDEDNNPVKQASVKLYDENTLLDTLTTDNTGNYTKTISNLSVGSHSLHTSFEGTSNFNASTSSNIIITVSEPTYNLVLSSTTPIIQSGDSAIVNALLTHNGSAYSSQSLSYTVKHGSTTIDTGTVTTGSDGTASISYTGTGVGDVEFIVEFGRILQKTYEVEDCVFYSEDGTGLTGTYTTGTDGTYSYITNIQDNVQVPNISISGDYVFSMKHYAGGTDSWGNSLWLIGSDSSNGLLIGAERTNTRLRIYNWNNGSASAQQTRNSSYSASTWYDLEIEYSNGVWSVKANGYTISYSKTFTTNIIKAYSEERYARLCEIKVKKL